VNAVEAQVEAVGALVREVLGGDAIGAYLHGSTATGRLQHRSDLDILVLARRPTADDEKRALIARLLRASGRGDPSGRARSIELTIVVEGDVRPWRYPPRFDFQYGDWLRADFEGGILTPWTSPNPDVAVLITMARAADRPVFGPPATEAFEPVPHADLERSIVDGIPGLIDDLKGDEANVILTFARIWTTLATGQIRSKDEAADWALARLPEDQRAVLARARAVYVGSEPDTWADLEDRIGPHVEHVLVEIERAKVGSRG
jgi:predicted nucleotidyltransferase